MHAHARRLATALASACAWICVLAALQPLASAQAQIAFTPCGDSNNFACGHLTVPLDPTGATPGTITLAMRRHRAPVGEAHSAIIALAGGPGQPALPFAEAFAELLRRQPFAVVGRRGKLLLAQQLVEVRLLARGRRGEQGDTA